MNGKVILGILVVISAAVGYVFYSSSKSEWNDVEPVEVPMEEPAVEEPDAKEPKAVEPSPEQEAPTDQDSESEESEPVTPEAEPMPEPEADAPEAPEVVEEAPNLVQAPASLNNSDQRVKSAVTDLAQKMVRWLTPAEQIRKWVLTVDMVAGGKIPYKHSPVKYDKDPFLVLPAGDETFVADSGNYTRWNTLVSVLTDVPAEDAARYYQEWRPLFERAYGELGKGGSFHQRFLEALGQVRTVSEPPVGAKLVRPHIFYQYADPSLEEASALSKWMWRLGPQHMLELQDFARNLSAELSYQ